MEKPTGACWLFLISAIFLTTMLLSFQDADASTGSHTHQLDMFFPPGGKSTASYSDSICNGGSLEECLMNIGEEEEGEGEEEEEWEMDSEINRRILYARRRYISYGALIRDRVPCSRRGYSYYYCRPGRPVNPYRRGCSAITRCRS